MKPRQQLTGCVALIFLLGILAIVLVGCQPATENYNTNCTYSYSDETWDHYDCDSGIQMKRIPK